jgi:hypothetical protein
MGMKVGICLHTFFFKIAKLHKMDWYPQPNCILGQRAKSLKSTIFWDVTPL